MADNDAFSRAADDLTQPPEQVPPRKARSRKAATPPPEPPAAQPPAPQAGAGEGASIYIPPEQIRAAMRPFLKAMAQLTDTSPPEPEEVEGITGGLTHGLAHTKIASGPNSGPWVPLLVVMTLYTLPRAIEAVMKRAERKEAAQQGGGFPEPEPSRIAADAPPAPPASTDSDGSGPVPAIGARGVGR